LLKSIPDFDDPPLDGFITFHAYSNPDCATVPVPAHVIEVYDCASDSKTCVESSYYPDGALGPDAIYALCGNVTTFYVRGQPADKPSYRYDIALFTDSKCTQPFWPNDENTTTIHTGDNDYSYDQSEFIPICTPATAVPGPVPRRAISYGSSFSAALPVMMPIAWSVLLMMCGSSLWLALSFSEV